MSKPRMEGFQKPIQVIPRQAGKSSLARIHEEDDERGAGAECSCGWIKVHRRKKVVTTAVDKHVRDKHHGRAIWV